MPDNSVPKSQVIKISDLPRQRSERFVSLYTNHVEANTTFHDLRLTFCQVVRDAKGEPAMEEQSALSLAWELAIRLRDLLDRLVQDYERDNGKIRIQQSPDLSGEPTEPPNSTRETEVG